MNEFEALSKISEILSGFDSFTSKRLLNYLSDKLADGLNMAPLVSSTPAKTAQAVATLKAIKLDVGAGNMIAAIKALREAAPPPPGYPRIGLKEAKDAVELYRQFGNETEIRRFLQLPIHGNLDS